MELTASNADVSRTHYSRAPILQAVIDFVVDPADNARLEALASAKWSDSGDFAVGTPIFHANIDLGSDDHSPTATRTQLGYQYPSADKKRVISARINGFSFSRLPPYESWEPFCEEARRLWSVYRDVRKPASVIRVAVRYINRLELPIPIADFRDYLRTVPEVSPALPQGLSGFLIQIKIPQVDLPGGMLILNEGLLESTSTTAAILLDIDLSLTSRFDPGGEELWDALGALHDRKNFVFESSVTDRTKELIR